MGAAIINTYLLLLFLLVHFKIVRFNLFWKLSPFIVMVLVLFGLLIPMNWGAPQGSAIVVRNAVSIVPSVAGEVTDVPVIANAPLKAGDVLFKIDPAPVFEFDADNMYSESDIDDVRHQLSSPGWNALAQIRQRRSGKEDVDVFVSMDRDKVNGVAIIASGPRRFTIVNIVGSIDPAKLAKLEDRFGLPSLAM